MRRARWLLLLIAGCASPDLRVAYDYRAHEGAHAEGAIEWWYHFGFLQDEEREWSWFSAFFRTREKNGFVRRYLIFDLTDMKTGRSTYRSLLGSESLPTLKQVLAGVVLTHGSHPETKRWVEALSHGTLPAPHAILAGSPREQPGDALDLAYGDHRFAVESQGYRLRVQDLDVSLHPQGSAMYVNGTGLVGVHTPDDMHYYSLPWMAAKGELVIEGRPRPVTGEFWHDHQWGDTWGTGQNGWCWWGLRTQSGEALNIYLLRRLKDGYPLQGVITLQDGDRRRVERDVRFTPIESWTSPTSGVIYPVSWKIQAEGLAIEIRPEFRERELPLLGRYEHLWEGPCRATVNALPARGFQELVGYTIEQHRTWLERIR